MSDLDEYDAALEDQELGPGDSNETVLLGESSNPVPDTKDDLKRPRDDITRPGGYETVEPFFRACVDKWRGAWDPATILTIDESMVGWSGMGEGALTFLPRKPCDLGIMLKTLCCAESGVLINAEICEGKKAMQQKEYVAEWGATTATTLRILRPYFG